MPRALLLAVLVVLLAPSSLLGQQELIGTWRYGNHTIEIRGDGTAVVDGETVQYTVRGTTLRFSGRDGDRSYAFGVGRDSLRLESGGVIETYKRVVPAAPPPAHEPDTAPPTREPDATRQAPARTTSASTEPAAPSDSPRLEGPTPGRVLVTAVVGPRGGTVEAPGVIAIDLPPGALGRDEEISIREGTGGPGDRGTCFVETRNGGHLDLDQPATIRIPSFGAKDDVVVFQEIDERTAVGVKPTWSAASESLVFTVNHFSWLSWGSLQKWAGYAGGWTVIILVASGGGWTLGTFALHCVVGAALGTVEAPMLEHLRQTYGLDAAVRSPHFSVLYAREGKYALGCRNPSILVRQNDQWSHVSATTVEEARKRYPNAQDVVGVDPDIGFLVCELETVHKYYSLAGYAPPDHTWVAVWPGSNVAGEWDAGPPGHPGFLRIDASMLPAVQRAERQQTISHEFVHAICDHHGWEGMAPCTEESLTTTMESEIFPSCEAFLKNYPWKGCMKFLENGLVASGGPNEGGADSVKRGYWLWPFGKFLLHRMGGHEDVRKYLQGTLDDEMLAVTFKLFVRALFDEDGLPEADADARPLVAETAPFKVPTGWGGYSATSMVSDEPLPWGEADPKSSFGALRRLSFAMRKVDLKLPRRFRQEEVPLLVVRRKVPMELEEYLFKGDGGNVILAKKSLVLTGKEMIEGGGDALVGRLGIYNVCRNAYDDPLVVYLLASPNLKLALPESGEPPPFPLYEIEPLEIQGASGGVNPKGLAAGYRVILREPPKEGESEGALVESEVLLPLDRKTFDVRDVAGDLSPEHVTVAGICVEDGTLKDGAGMPLRSCPFMLDESQIPSLVIRGGVDGKGVIGAEYEFSAVGTLIPASARYEWSFGDDGHATGGQVKHGYKREGTYTITLRASWGASEMTAQKRIEIAPNVAEAKAEVNIYVFRWRKNKMGRSKQACQIIHVAILNKEGQVIDGGHADGNNGLFSIVLPVGHYGYKVDYRYTNPPDSGSATGAFDVREGDQNWVEVETTPSEAFDK